MGNIVQISVSGGGVPKLPVVEARVTTLGLAGDVQKEKEIHGGPERALCLWSVERIEALTAEGHPVQPGSVGENITTRGIDWDGVVPGSRLRMGDQVEIEITRYTTPCTTIRRSFADGDSNRIHQNLHPGWSRVYARVLREGIIRRGDHVQLMPAAVSVGADA